jgi:hypothetical protein
LNIKGVKRTSFGYVRSHFLAVFEINIRYRAHDFLCVLWHAMVILFCRKLFRAKKAKFSIKNSSRNGS